LSIKADTPPQTPPALKLASMQLLSSERGAIASEQVNCVQQKIITYRNQGEQIGQSGNTSPPTQSKKTFIKSNHYPINLSSVDLIFLVSQTRI
jgi:hypothetical protein